MKITTKKILDNTKKVLLFIMENTIIVCKFILTFKDLIKLIKK